MTGTTDIDIETTIFNSYLLLLIAALYYYDPAPAAAPDVVGGGDLADDREHGYRYSRSS